MPKLALGVAIIALCGAVYAYASPRLHAPSDSNRILGLTEAEVTGSPFDLVRACDHEFPGSHVCTPRDLMRTSIAPDGLRDFQAAWIDGTSLQSGGGTLICGLGGGTGSGFETSSFHGAAIFGDEKGTVFVQSLLCGRPARVACCGNPRRMKRDK